MWDKKIIAITDRHACEGDFMRRLRALAAANVGGIMLREKDMSEFDYYDLAKEVLALCKRRKIACFLHSFDRVALKLGHKRFHCPLPILRQEPRLVRYFDVIGTSVHSREELDEAVGFGCNYAIFGHIYPTLSKPFAPPKGLDELNALCKASKIPIYAVGGINADNVVTFANTAVAGLCIKNALMQCDKPGEYLRLCEEGLKL